MREGQAGQGEGGGGREAVGEGVMGAPPVLIGQATQKRGSTVTGKGRQAVGGGGGGGARGGWRGGGWGRLLY